MQSGINQMDLHTHSIASGHAYATILEMAKAAAQVPGLRYLGITDHAPGIKGAPDPIYFANFEVIPRTLFGIRLLMGSEINITDYHGSLSLPDRYIHLLDLGIAGIHQHCYTPGTVEQNTAAIIGAISHPRIHIISHPDDGSVPLDYKAVVSAAKAHHTLLEVNNSSLQADPADRPGVRENLLTMLSYCKKMDVPVIMSSDAHFTTQIAQVEHCRKLIREACFPDELIVNYHPEMMAKFLACKGFEL